MRTAITLFFLVSLLCSSLSAATLTQAQKDQLKTLLPGVTLSDSTIEKLEDVFYYPGHAGAQSPQGHQPDGWSRSNACRQHP